MEPYFFLSYARVDGRRVLVKRFYDDLCEEVRSLGDTGGAAGQPFLDIQSIQVGQDWQTALADALGRCRTMVALYAPDFFRSTYCGREWKAFHDRLQRHRDAAGADSKALLPVLWEPVTQVPPGIAHIQYANDELGETYHRIGLRRMLATDPSGEYRHVVRVLAQQVRRAAENFRLPVIENIRLDSDDARGPFPVEHGRVEPGSHVQFFVAARTPGARTPGAPAARAPKPTDSATEQRVSGAGTWNPYPARSSEGLLQRARALVEQRGFSTDAEDVGEQLTTRLDEARELRQVAILLVEVWAAADAPCFAPLHTYDRENHPATGTIVPCAPGEADSGPQGKPYWDTVRSVFPRNWMRSTGELIPLFRAGVDDASFDGCLNAMVTVAQNQLFSTAPASRVPRDRPPIPLPVLRVPSRRPPRADSSPTVPPQTQSPPQQQATPSAPDTRRSFEIESRSDDN